MKVVSIVLGSVFSVCVALPAGAQERAWFLGGGDYYTPFGMYEAIVGGDGINWAAGRRIGPITGHLIAAGPVFFRGRYIVWLAKEPYSSAAGVVRFDTRTGDVALLPWPLVSPSAIAVDPRSGYLMIADAVGVHFTSDIHALTIPHWDIPSLPHETRSLAEGAGLTFLGRSTPTLTFTEARDNRDGTVIGFIPDAVDGQVSSDERRFLVQRRTSSTYEMTVWDTTTLSPIERHSVDVGLTSAVPFKLVDNILYTSWRTGFDSPYDFNVRALDANSFATVGEMVRRLRDFPSYVDIFHNSSTRPYYVRVGPSLSDTACAITAVDPAHGLTQPVTISRVGPTLHLPCDGRLLMYAVPDAPFGVRGQITNGTVTLVWNAPANVGDYEVSAGLAPGRRDFSFRTGGRAFFTANNVPPGRYFVRIRAINELGSSESEEVVLFVS